MDTQICNGIHWVGYVDWTVRDFHGYNTNRGATYNSYLIEDEQCALIDTVKGPYAQHLLANVQGHVDLSRIKYVVCNHGEPDHSSGFPAVMKVLPHATILVSAKGQQTLNAYYDTDGWNMQVVKTGDSVSLGNRTLHFLETPMVHWPDSMMTYVPQEKLLFSMDAFGQHYSSSYRFDDENPITEIMAEARTYYANIVTPYGGRVVKTMEAAAQLEIEVIAPSHGVIWRKHIPEILKAYRNWALCKSRRKLLVIYDSMWGSTAQMAQAICEGAMGANVEAKLIAIRQSDLTNIATEMLDAAAVAFGSSTLNQEMLPPAAAALTYLKGLRFTNRAAFSFGSFGWGKGGPEAVGEMLKACKWELTRECLKAKYKPNQVALDECRAAGAELATKAIEIADAAGYEPLLID
ncbi:MAG: FprA family A-type flavoprotein [Lentisphaeria bacterium]|nr:FprA family A-type flavoprotein [Lentisphaeria bacterium]